MSCTGVTSMGSAATPTTMSLPLGPSPSISSDIAFELGAVARITCAPPNFCNASAAFVARLNAEVTQAADPLDGNEVAGQRTTVPQRVIGGDAGAEQRGGFDVRETLG